MSSPLPGPSLRIPLAISLGAIAGALSRYYLSLWITQRLATHFPWGTLVVNLVGAGGMGLFATLVLEHALSFSPEIRLIIAVGFLGSFTTFSTYALDTMTLLKRGHIWEAGLYWLGSAIAGLLCFYLGTLTARFIR